MNDSYIDALNYAIKEEIADHYFHDRKVVDEEIAELEGLRQEDLAQAEQTRNLLADLAAVLIDPAYWEGFWKKIGVTPPPLSSLPDSKGRAWRGTSSGFGWKGRYKGLAKRTAERLADQIAKCLEVNRTLAALVEEVNGDIVHFNQNHDFLMLRSVLCEMDPDLVSKKHWLGTTLEGEACFDLGDSMAFRKQAPARPVFWALEQPPDSKAMVRAAAEKAALILKERAREVRSRMGGQA